ncbi:unnamed protein product [Nezara viridula]|uniref:Uncharacterized protein n=1 Tax=Nezara viridula TaxID=85310 RepID=A0A9P0HMZ3_NEZVI|nr:unnamed protein product [Nezara viridula]
MIGFGCATIRLNKHGCIDGPPPVMKLVGDQLLKRDTKYWKIKDTVTNLHNGLRIGTSSNQIIGKTEVIKMGVHSVNTIGVIPRIDIYRKKRILGKVKSSIFGQREFAKIGVVSINSQPPSAITVTPSKSQMKIPENYWTIAAENIKKISSAIKNYFKDIKE